MHKTLHARKFRSFDVMETISTRYCRKFKKLKGLYDHCWGVLEAGSCCVKAKRDCAGAGKCFLSTVDLITVTWSRHRNTLIFFGLYIRSPVNQYLMQHYHESRHLLLRLFCLSTLTRQIGSCWKSKYKMLVLTIQSKNMQKLNCVL